MTDNEIKKALECCTTNGASCKDCPAFVKVDRSNCKKYFRGALDLINRLQAENERLKKESEIFADIGKMYSEVKAEAYKEFAERLKEKYKHYVILGSGVAEIEIDNLLKEKVGAE